MKSTYGYLAGAVLSLALIPTAHAQQTMYGVGTCMGMYSGQTLAGNTQLYVGDPGNNYTKGALVPSNYASAVFNKAECQCKSRDIRMYFRLTTPLGNVANPPGTTMYIGQSGCEMPTTRTNGICDQVDGNHPADSRFSLPGESFKYNLPFDVVIPPEVVTNPESASSYTECSTGGPQSYTITVAVGPDTGPAVCTLPVEVNTQGPHAPEGLSAIKGDGALTLHWSVPDGTTGIKWYQVLCRNKARPNELAMSKDFLDKTPYYFSSCIGGKLYRQRIGELNTGSDPADTAVPALGGEFAIDPRLRCSDKITPSVSQLSTRITGLENGQTYEVMVVAIDSFGNATPSAVVSETPKANESPLGNYCEGEACPGFGCQAGTGAPGAASGAGAAVGLLALGLLLVGRARRAA